MNKIYLAAFLVLAGCTTLIPLKVSETIALQVEVTPENVQKGEYLANNVMLCMHCHSEVDWNYYGGLIKDGMLGAGGEFFKEWFGTVYGTNITPANLDDWTDSEIAKAIVEGVHKSGQALFPVMPYPTYRTLAKEDLESLIAYLRSLDPVDHTLPEKKLKLPFKYIERTVPAKYTPMEKPLVSEPFKYGEYLAQMGDCIRCHTPFDNKGIVDETQLLKGGNEFRIPSGGKTVSPDISSDPDNGIGGWSKEDFIETFKEYEVPREVTPEMNTIMAWSYYAGMTEEDLGAIYDYLMAAEPEQKK